MGAASALNAPSLSAGVVITGSIVESASGSRRVRNRFDACLYIFEIWEEPPWREETELIEEESICEDDIVAVFDMMVSGYVYEPVTTTLRRALV
jgi:hypothetical protein